MSRVLAFLPNSFTTNFTVVLDEIQNEIKKGNDLFIIGCEGSINHCEMNLSGSQFICDSCTHCLKHSLKFIYGSYKYYTLKDFNQKSTYKDYDKELNRISSMQELKKLQYENYEVGYAVASTYISETRNHNPFFSDKYRRFISKLLADSIYIYENSKIAIKKIKPSKIIIFNGRLHISRPVVSLAETFDIPVDILEVVGGNGVKPFEKVKFENYLPHSIENNTKLIIDNWDRGCNDKENKGKTFFENRKKGVAAGDKVYIENQLKGLLPQGFDKRKKNIAIFNSSEDEMAAIGKEWEWSFFGGNQLKAIEKILTIMTPYQDYIFYIRVHPNLKNIMYNYHTDYYLLESNYKNVRVIPADSKISTYALIDHCDKIITFGSSVGIEATYWGKPSILIGKSMYMNLDVTYNITDEKSLENLLIDESLTAKPLSNTLKYGYFIYGRQGESFEYFDPNPLIKKPTWLNANLFIYNINPKKKFTINALLNFFGFSMTRLLNHFVYNRNIPIDEKNDI